MKVITKDLLSSIYDSAVVEYTKNRFMAEEECEELRQCLLESFADKIESEEFLVGKTVLTLAN